MKKLEKVLIYIIVAVLFLFNIYLLVLNNKNVDIDSHNSLIAENFKLKQLNSYSQKDFNHLLGKHYSFLDEETNKKILFYVPQTACGICLEKLFNKYWDNYLEKVSDQIVVLYEDKSVKNIYYLSEGLVESQLIDPIRGHKNNETIIFFNIENKLFYPVTFDLSLINYIEPYFSRYLQRNNNNK